MVGIKSFLNGGLVALVLLLGCSPGENHNRSLDPDMVKSIEVMRSAYDQEEFSTALFLADSIERMVPGILEVEYTRGLTLNALRRYTEAHTALSHVVDQDPDFRGAWYHLGHNAFLQRRYREAIESYENERTLVARLLKKNKENAPDPQALPTIIAQIGRSYDKMGVPDSARMAYEEALSLDSTLAVAHAWLGEWYENQGRLEEAFHHARKASWGDPHNLEYIYRLGYLYLQNGFAAESIPFLGLVAQKWPGHEGAFYNLGRALKVVGKEKEGQAFLDRVEDIQNLQEEALVAERGVETYPNEPGRWITLAGLMLRSGYYDKAEQAFQAAYALDPENLSVQNDLANLALARGDTAKAIQRFQNLLHHDTTFADGWLNLGIIYALKGRKEEAKNAWHHVLEYRPDDRDARRYLAELDRTRQEAR